MDFLGYLNYSVYLAPIAKGIIYQEEQEQDQQHVCYWFLDHCYTSDEGTLLPVPKVKDITLINSKL